MSGPDEEPYTLVPPPPAEMLAALERQINAQDNGAATILARARAHEILDHALNLQEQWAEAGWQDQAQARAIYTAALSLIGQAFAQVRECAAPVFMHETPPNPKAGAPDPMLSALMQTLEMLSPVWPQSPNAVGLAAPGHIPDDHLTERDTYKTDRSNMPADWENPPVGAFSVGKRTLRCDDLIKMLEMHWQGEQVPLLQKRKMQGDTKWTERRLRFQAVLWSMHLQATRKKPGSDKLLPAEHADHEVHLAFSEVGARGKLENGRLATGPLPKWRAEIRAIEAGQHDPFISREMVIEGIRCAKDWVVPPFKGNHALADGSAELADLQHAHRVFWQEQAALMLHHCAFGTMINGTRSLREAGKMFLALGLQPSETGD